MKAAVKTRLARRGLRNRDFSIVSNDCWGGIVYQRLGLPYTTPFAGLFLMAPDYLRLLEDLEATLAAPLEFSAASKHEEVNAKRATGALRADYPVGHLGDVEIQFLHYSDPRKAAADWSRRLARLDLDRLWVKGDGSKDLAGPEHRARFDALPYERKVMFLREPDPACASGIVIPGYSEDADLIVEPAERVFDVVAWLNGGDGRR